MSESPVRDRDDSDESEGSLVKIADEPPKNVTTQKQSFLDKVLVDYVKFTSSAANTDVSLKLMQWTIWLASYMKKSKGLQKLSTDLSFARYAVRLLGLPSSVEAARTGSWGGNTTNPWIRKLGKVMAWSMMGYYPLEHLAYLRWTSPQLLPGHSAEKWSAYSCRCWLLYIVADITKSTIKLKELLSRRSQVADDGNEGEALVSLNHSIRNEQLQIVRSLLFTLPAIHWSLPRWNTHPWLKESVVNGLMWTEAVVSFYQSLYRYSFQG